MNQRVAVKFLLAEAAANEEANARFKQEARAAAHIQNEHVARVVDVSTEGGLPYMVMEYLDGQDLSQLLEERRSLPPEEACSYVLQACDAIHAAHKSGIIHRDLKPSNLFLARRADGTTILKVLDFGISKAQNGLGPMSGALTSTKAMLGSPLYMSPEQLRSSKSVDARADIWALGVILYELLTGAVPYAGENLGELFAAILEQDPVPVRQRAPHVAPELEGIVMRCLQRHPNARFGSVAELAHHLAPFSPSQSGLSVLTAARTQVQAGGFSSPASYTQVVGQTGQPGPSYGHGGAGAGQAAQPYGHPGHSGGAAYPGGQGPRGSQPSVPAFAVSTGNPVNVPVPTGTAALGGGFVPTGHSASGADRVSEASAAGMPAERSNSALLLGIAAVMVLAALGIGGYTLSKRGTSAASAAASASTTSDSPVSSASSTASSLSTASAPPSVTAVATAAPSAVALEPPPATPVVPPTPAGAHPAKVVPGGPRKPPPVTPVTPPPTPPPTPVATAPAPTAKPASTLQTSR